jgi:D-sedoheptulose 7-phosphate isomerase
MTYISNFLADSIKIIERLDQDSILRVIDALGEVKKNKGRVFFCGSGGGAGHSSHAAADFRKILGIESYSVTDNVSELTARINDHSWETSYSDWLRASNFSSKDSIFIISVGGGSLNPPISLNLVSCVDLAKEHGAKIFGIVGRDGGYVKESTDLCVLIPTVNPENITAQTEGFQSLVWHLLIGVKALAQIEPKWESVK